MMIEKIDRSLTTDGPLSAAVEGVGAMGPTFDLDVLKRTAMLYAPLVRGQSRDGVGIERDIAYGPDERHRLDLFRPASPGPVIIFVHGGGFVAGDKNVDADFYSNIGVYFARRGYLTLTMNYRRAPQHLWPAASHDLARVVAWVRTHALDQGGDPDSIFVFGQSAGACHVAGYLFSPELRPVGSGVKGGILMSGVYRAFGEDPGPGIGLYFGDDEVVRRAECPVSRAAHATTPLLVGVMEFDPPSIAVHTIELVQALHDAGRPARRAVSFAGHNHASTVYSLGSGQDDIGHAIIDFIAEQRRA